MNTDMHIHENQYNICTEIGNILLLTPICTYMTNNITYAQK